MATFFPLPFRCTLQRGEATTERSGQVKLTFVDVSTPKCLFLTTSGGKVALSGETFEGVMAFYVESTVDIQEGDRVTNILDKKGNLMEAGPYEVLSVKRVPNLTGTLHHQSCKVKGLN